MKKLSFFLAILFLAGCATAPPKVVSQLPDSPSVIRTGFYHTVDPSDTLDRIARRYHAEVSELMRLNQIFSPTHLEAGSRIFIPKDPVPLVVPAPTVYEKGPLSLEEVETLVGPKHEASVWRTITLHHSATLNGNARLFDRDHRRRKMGGLFYHFVIGNGHSSRDGGIEVGWRWKKQLKANRPYDVQICLVGDFSRQAVSDAQFASLVYLISVLQEQYSVPISSLRRHEDIKGKHTECPGRNFPFERILTRLAANGRTFKRG